MKRITSLLYFATLAFASLSSVASAQDLPVSRTAGVIDVSIPINQTSLVAIPLVDIVASGTITSVSGTTLGVSSTLGALSGPHAIKITSRDDQRGTGANAPGTAGDSTNGYGQTGQISSNTTGAGSTVTTATALTPNVGDEFVIYPLETLTTLFGTPPAAGWNGSTGAGSADIVYIDNAGVLTGYFYKTNAAFGGAGWKLVSNPTGSAFNDTVIPVNRGLLVQRRNAGTAFNIRNFGVTLPGRETGAVVAGFNIMNNPFSVTTTLAASGLVSHVTGSTGAGSADLVYLETAGVLTGYYYKTGGLGGAGWRTTADGSTDRGNVALTAGKAILFQEKAGTVGFALPEPFAE